MDLPTSDTGRSVIPILAVSYRNPEGMARLRSSVESSDFPAIVYEHDNTKDNIGYTAGVNRLIKQLLDHENPDYFIITSHDVQFMPGSLKALHDFMHAHPACGIAGCKQLLTSDPDRIWHGGTGHAELGEHIQGRVSNGDCNVSKFMSWVNGAVMIVRTSAARLVGPMDEQFFLFGSDSDWCYRFRLKNWAVWYCADATVLHDVGISERRSATVGRHHTSDMERWIAKWAEVSKIARKNQRPGTLII